VLIDVRCPVMAVNGDNHRETNTRLGCRYGDRKDCDHHAGWWVRWRSETPERNEIQVRRSEHHLDADQNENGGTPAERCEQAYGKQRRGNDEESLECGCHSSTARKRPTSNVQRPSSNSETQLNRA